MSKQQRQRPTFVGYNGNDAEVERLDLLCRYTATSRADFMRCAVAFLDSALTLDELARLNAQNGGLAPAQARVREEATQTMASVLDRLRPRPLVAASLN